MWVNEVQLEAKDQVQIKTSLVGSRLVRILKKEPSHLNPTSGAGSTLGRDYAVGPTSGKYFGPFLRSRKRTRWDSSRAGSRGSSEGPTAQSLGSSVERELERSVFAQDSSRRRPGSSTRDPWAVSLHTAPTKSGSLETK